MTSVTRRDFVKTASAVAVAGPLTAAATANAAGSDEIRVGLIGCGGRGTGAAYNNLDAAPNTRIVALADAFPDRLEACRNRLKEKGERGTVADDRCHVGFNAYRELIDGDVDMVILATPPHFRPAHFEAAVDAGKHVFMEKPVAVDPAGVRRVLKAGETASNQRLSVAAGTQRRHEACYIEMMRRIHAGEIGHIVSARCFWNMGTLWSKKPQPAWSDMEWQMRNWLYFTWLSGDHIVEQHVHNLDVVNWAMGSHPIRAMGMGGRQVRTDSDFGNIFDHFAIEYEYANGAFLTSMCRQTDGCANRVAEFIHGSEGTTRSRSGNARIEGRGAWEFEGRNPNPYVQEHADIVASIQAGGTLNEARNVAESTLTAIMGRMSAYTGKQITWEQALNSTLDLTPDRYEFGPLAIRAVATPGKTPLA